MEMPNQVPLSCPCPPGWRRKVVKRLRNKTLGVQSGYRFEVFYYSTTGKRFRNKNQLHKFLKNTNLSIDQFPFILSMKEKLTMLLSYGGKVLTELEELDLYYDWEFVDNEEYRPASRSLFEGESLL